MLTTLTCPVCRSEVSSTSAGCRSCHLPIADVTRHQGVPRRRRGSLALRLWGVLVYGAIAAWSLWQLPTSAVFVVPAAVAAVVLHSLRGRPYVAALVFLLVVAVAPALLWPSMTTDVMDDLGSRF